MRRVDDNLSASKQARLRSFVNPFFVNHPENSAAYYTLLRGWCAIFLWPLGGDAVCQQAYIGRCHSALSWHLAMQRRKKLQTIHNFKEGNRT